MTVTKNTLLKALKENFGFTAFKGNQEAIIQNLLDGKNTFVLMPTGGGKSLCYQLPCLIMEGTAVVISPLIALMKNQVDAMRGFHTNDSVAHFLNSSLNKTEIAKVKDDILAGRTKLLYVAPESLTKDENVEFLKQIKISFYAIDEAHCISEWGHDFRPEYRNIRPIVERICKAPIIALTATATPKVQSDIQKNLGMLDATTFKASFRRENLYYEIRPKTDPTKDIIKILKSNPGKAAIIYCLSRKTVEELAETLAVNDIKALPYHAGLDGSIRSANQDKFLMEEVNVIVATIAFGMGIDKPNVRYVFHYDMPKSLEGYYQETGRAGRDGGEGRCIAFYDPKDMNKLEKFMQGKPVAEQEIGKQLLYETVSYAETAVCRARHLLDYFGEELKENCGCCDNCAQPKRLKEGKEYVATVIETVLEVKEKFKAPHIVDIICGEATQEVKTYKHDAISSFAGGKEKSEKFWISVIRQMLIAKLLDKDIENYGIVKVTKLGNDFLKKPTSFMVTEEREADEDEDSSEDSSSAEPGAVDPALMSILKDLRKKMSKKMGVPPFVIFQDNSLEDMAVQYPISMDELTRIAGVGQGKAQKYGKEFVELIKKYVEENEIERPQDLIVKSVVNKSSMKVYIIQSIDRKLPLETIAEAKGLDILELLDEIESIVNSGTKINIDYYINEVMDEDHQDEIFEYFKDAATESIEDALKELGEDEFTEEDVRLMRIKFISEMGN